jgi:hypothetical protein
MCGSNKVAGQQTCGSPVHIPQSQVSHFGETEEQRWYIISGVPRNFVRGGSKNSVEDKGQKERGSGGSSPLVRGSAQFLNE